MNGEEVKLFENKINNNLFKFLVRQYFGNTMNPYQIVKILSKMLSSKISKVLKLKYILFFLMILKRITIYESVFTSNVNPIINETLSDVLTRKADFVIVIEYAIFLVKVKQIDFALSRLQIFSTDPRFMNNGELIFYKGIISYISDSNNKVYLNLFEKGLPLIKNNSNLYCEWLVNFLISKNLIAELSNFLKLEKIRENISKNKKYHLFLNAFSDTDLIDPIKKINIISEELKTNFVHIYLISNFRNLIISYYQDKHQGQCQVDDKFTIKLIKIDQTYIITYLKSLYTIFLFEYMNPLCIFLLEEILKEIHFFLENQIEFLDSDNQSKFYDLMFENIRLLIEIVLKDKLCKNILNISLRNSKNSIWKIQDNYENKINHIKKILILIDFNFQLLHGEGYMKKYNIEFKKKSLFLDLCYTKNFIVDIKKINYK